MHTILIHLYYAHQLLKMVPPWNDGFDLLTETRCQPLLNELCKCKSPSNNPSRFCIVQNNRGTFKIKKRLGSSFSLYNILMTAPYRKVAYLKLINKYALSISLLFVAPIVLCILGIVVVCTGNARINSILSYPFLSVLHFRYNERLDQYFHILPQWKSMEFTVNEAPLSLYETPNTTYYPVADSCTKAGDPEEGCVFSTSTYFTTNISIPTNVLNITLYTVNHTLILSESIPLSSSKRLNQKVLDCWDVNTCTEYCKKRDGVWDYMSGECVITFFLTSICYRIALTEDSAVIDRSEYVFGFGLT